MDTRNELAELKAEQFDNISLRIRELNSLAIKGYAEEVAKLKRIDRTSDGSQLAKASYGLAIAESSAIDTLRVNMINR